MIDNKGNKWTIIGFGDTRTSDEIIADIKRAEQHGRRYWPMSERVDSSLTAQQIERFKQFMQRGIK